MALITDVLALERMGSGLDVYPVNKVYKVSIKAVEDSVGGRNGLTCTRL